LPPFAADAAKILLNPPMRAATDEAVVDRLRPPVRGWRIAPPQITKMIPLMIADPGREKG
jgi:hypothetical protein